MPLFISEANQGLTASQANQDMSLYFETHFLSAMDTEAILDDVFGHKVQTHTPSLWESKYLVQAMLLIKHKLTCQIKMTWTKGQGLAF